MINETLIPKVGVITDIRKDTPDVKTFRVVGTDGKKLFGHMPGQCAMVSIPGVWGMHVLHHLFAYKRRIYGIFH